MSVRVHRRGEVEEPEWRSLKFRSSEGTKYHVALHLKHKNNLHLKFHLPNNSLITAVQIFHSHSKNPEKFTASIMKIGSKKHLIIQNLPQFIARKIVMDLNEIDKRALVARTDKEFETISKQFLEKWKVRRKNAIAIVLAHILDLHRLGRESHTLLKELRAILREGR